MLVLHRHLIELSLLLVLCLMGPVSVVGPHSVLVYHMVAFDIFAFGLLLVYLSHLRLRQHVLVLRDGPARVPLGGLRLGLVLRRLLCSLLLAWRLDILDQEQREVMHVLRGAQFHVGRQYYVWLSVLEEEVRMLFLLVDDVDLGGLLYQLGQLALSIFVDYVVHHLFLLLVV